MEIKVNALWLSIWTILVLSPAVLSEKWAWPDSHGSTGTSRSLYDEQQSDESGDVLRFRDTDDSERESLNRYEDRQFERCTCGVAYSCVAPGVLLDGCNNGKSLCCFGPKNGKSYDEESYRNGIYPEQNREANFYPNRQSGYGGSSNILIGPSGPTGIIGPSGNGHNQYAENFNERPNALIDPSSNNVLVGPGGPTGIIGPDNRLQSSNGVLVGPGGPTGIIGPGNRQSKGVLVGPGGPTGIIGPGNRQHSNGVLVGPGGPTGIIGPGYNSFRRPGYNRRPHAYNGVLVGPGGPTGIIGSGGYRGSNRYSENGILVGPGGPTGIIGPRLRSLDENTEFDDS